jgi:hypothetical protein
MYGTLLQALLGLATDTEENAYLDKLRQSMFDVSGCWVSEATIWWTLVHSGYTLKKAGLLHSLYSMKGLQASSLYHTSCD